MNAISKNLKVMDNFIKQCKAAIIPEYKKIFKNHLEENGIIFDEDDILVVWSCKTLQNYKAIFTTDISGDGVIIECTFNGDKDQLYVDIYCKVANACLTGDLEHIKGSYKMN